MTLKGDDPVETWEQKYGDLMQQIANIRSGLGVAIYEIGEIVKRLETILEPPAGGDKQ